MNYKQESSLHNADCFLVSYCLIRFMYYASLGLGP